MLRPRFNQLLQHGLPTGAVLPSERAFLSRFRTSRNRLLRQLGGAQHHHDNRTPLLSLFTRTGQSINHPAHTRSHRHRHANNHIRAERSGKVEPPLPFSPLSLTALFSPIANASSSSSSNTTTTNATAAANPPTPSNITSSPSSHAPYPSPSLCFNPDLQSLATCPLSIPPAAQEVHPSAVIFKPTSLAPGRLFGAIPMCLGISLAFTLSMLLSACGCGCFFTGGVRTRREGRIV